MHIHTYTFPPSSFIAWLTGNRVGWGRTTTLTYLFVAWKYSSDHPHTLQEWNAYQSVHRLCRAATKSSYVSRSISITRYSYASHRLFYGIMALSEASCSVSLPTPDTEPSDSHGTGAGMQRKGKQAKSCTFLEKTGGSPHRCCGASIHGDGSVYTSRRHLAHRLSFLNLLCGYYFWVRFSFSLCGGAYL